MNRFLRPLVVIVLATLVAASCSSSDDTTDVEPTTDQPSSDIVEPAEDDDPVEPAEDDDPAEPVDDPIELTASFRGVTEEVIKIGVVSVDFERLAAAGIDQNRGDATGTYIAAIEAINDRGGLFGRQIEIINGSYIPTQPEEVDEICLRLTEDEEVFLVVGVIRLDDVLCYTEAHDTAVVAINQQNQERLDRSTAPYVTVQGRSDERSTDWASAMVDAGVFEGETVGVIGFTDADEALYDETVAALRDAGIEPVEGLVGPSDGDVAANRAEAEVIFEKFRVEGVTVTVNASPTAGALDVAGGVSYDSEWVQNPLLAPGVLAAGNVDFEYIDGMLSVAPTSVGTLDQPAMADDPAVAECVATIEDRTDEVIDFAIEPEVDNAVTALNACGVATIVELALNAAGPDLTNDSLAAALAGLGEFALAGYTSASLGPDKTAAADAGRPVSFSAAEGAWVFVD